MEQDKLCPFKCSYGTLLSASCKSICSCKIMSPDSAKGLCPEFVAALKLNAKHVKFKNSCLAECSGFSKASLTLKMVSYLDGTGYPSSLDDSVF